MRTSTWVLFMTVSLLGGCGTVDESLPDSGGIGSGGGGDDGGSQTGGDLSTGMPSTVVGTWLSTGTNVAKGLAGPPFSVKSITGVFKADQTYAVTSTDSTGKMSTSAGTWTSVPSPVPGIFNLTQMQTQPSSATAQAIYKIDDTANPPVLTLEGVQTMPSLGATPPTAQGGFGSTVVSGKMTSDWVQTYVRQ